MLTIIRGKGNEYRNKSATCRPVLQIYDPELQPLPVLVGDMSPKEFQKLWDEGFYDAKNAKPRNLWRIRNSCPSSAGMSENAANENERKIEQRQRIYEEGYDDFFNKTTGFPEPSHMRTYVKARRDVYMKATMALQQAAGKRECVTK